jgi:hypothetical protein
MVSIRSGAPATATTTGSGTSPSLTLTGTRQPQAGDKLLIIHSNNWYTLSVLTTPTVGGSSTGVTAISGATVDGGSNNPHIKAWEYSVGSTGDLTIAATNSGAKDEEQALIVYVCADPAATLVDIAQGTFSSAVDPHTLTGVTTTVDNDILIGHIETGAITTYTAPAGMSEQYDINIGGFVQITGATQTLGVAGATGTRVFDPSGAVIFAGVLIALRGPPAVTFDVVTSGQITSNGATCTFSHTISSNADRVLLVFATGDKIADAGVTLSCTYGGVAMTALGTRHAGDDVNGFMTVFLLINPTSGTANVVVTQSVATGRISAGAMSFSNASQTAGDYTLTTAINVVNTHSITRSGTTSGSLIAFGSCSDTVISTQTQTLRWTAESNSGSAASDSGGATASGTGGSVVWSFTPVSSSQSALFAVEILIAGGGGNVPQVRSAATYASSANETSSTVPLPAGWQAGDLCYISYSMIASDGVIITPTGWSPIVPLFRPHLIVSYGGGVYKRILQGGDSAPAIQHTNGRFAAVSVAIFDHDSATPEDVDPVLDRNFNTGVESCRAPLVNPISENDLLITFHMTRHSVNGGITTFTVPSGMTQLAQICSTAASGTNAGVLVAALTLDASRAATGAKIAGTDNPSGSNEIGSAIVVRGSGQTPVANLSDKSILMTEDSYPLLQETRHHLLISS